jgi:hypothetical protein
VAWVFSFFSGNKTGCAGAKARTTQRVCFRGTAM